MCEVISKKLASKVLGFEIYEDWFIDFSPCNDLYFCTYSNPDSCFMEINIHDFVHRCKEWAYCNGIASIEEGKEENNKKDTYYLVIKHDNGRLSQFLRCELSQIKENLLKECQWILDNKL